MKYYTFLYKGVIIHNTDHLTNLAKVKAKKYIPFNKYKKSYIYDKVYGYTIFYDNFVGLSIYDRIIEPYEIDRGFVSLQDINELIDKESLHKSWNITSNKSDKDVFICQAEWRSNLAMNTTLYLNYNLPVL